jgi:hypothetical protein
VVSDYSGQAQARVSFGQQHGQPAPDNLLYARRGAAERQIAVARSGPQPSASIRVAGPRSSRTNNRHEMILLSPATSTAGRIRQTRRHHIPRHPSDQRAYKLRHQPAEGLGALIARASFLWRSKGFLPEFVSKWPHCWFYSRHAGSRWNRRHRHRVS